MNPIFSINGQPIEGSFFGKLVKKYGRDAVYRAFYHAYVAKPDNVVAWIQRGIKEKWIFDPVEGETAQKVLDFATALYEQKAKPTMKTNRPMQSLGQILRGME